MNLGQYANGQRDRYADFAKAVAQILSAAIRKNAQLRLQQIQDRAKQPDSLKAKLAKAGLLESDAIEDEIKDLAGCRLIFYTNSDVSKFLSSEILRSNFKIDRIRTKFHYPVPLASDDPSLFISNNFVVELNEVRAALPEYERFNGLRCEVQVQTILNHAWSEMEHDIIYKKPPLDGFGGRLMSTIEDRMKKIMRDYLIPAGYEFQKVTNDFERLSSGKALFDEGPINAILTCEDNNELHERLRKFKDHVLPLYGENIRADHADIREAILAAAKKGQARKREPIETPFGLLNGYTADQIIDDAADILDEIRFIDEDAVLQTFDAICSLFGYASSDCQRKRLLESAKRLAEHSLDIWNQAGPVIQRLLVDRISFMDFTKLGSCTTVVLEVLGEVLKPEVRGTSSTYNTITIKTGSIVPSSLLTYVRSLAIELLQSIFLIVNLDQEKRVVIQKLSEAGRTPHMGNYPNSLFAITLNDSAKIVRFFTEISSGQSYMLLEEIEHDCLWLYRRNRCLPSSMIGDAEIEKAKDCLIEAVMAYRDCVNADQKFVSFKTLVGFQSVFPPAWEDDDFDIERIDDYRKGEIDRLAGQVNDETSGEWLEFITQCANTTSNDLATFPSFGVFLEQLGCSQPAIVLSYFDKLDIALSDFLPAMLCGLEKTSLKEVTLEKVQNWIKEQKYLRQIINYCAHSAQLNFDILESAVRSAIETRDESAVFYAIQESVARFSDAPDKMIERIFLPTLRCLNSMENHRWIDAVWPRSRDGGLFQNLKGEQQDEVLAAMVARPEVNFRDEDLLKAIGESNPEKIIDFFSIRLKFEESVNPMLHYSAIPYDLSQCRSVLQKFPELVVQKVRDWFDTDNKLFAFRGGRFIKVVFPEPNGQVLAELHKLVAVGTKENCEFVIQVLNSYHGNVATHDLYKEIIESLPLDSELISEISCGLDSEGVVNGEFGYVATYIQKKAEIEPWLTDSREKVKEFSRQHIISLDHQIADEQRRAEQQLELRKRDFGIE